MTNSIIFNNYAASSYGTQEESEGIPMYLKILDVIEIDQLGKGYQKADEKAARAISALTEPAQFIPRCLYYLTKEQFKQLLFPKKTPLLELLDILNFCTKDTLKDEMIKFLLLRTRGIPAQRFTIANDSAVVRACLPLIEQLHNELNQFRALKWLLRTVDDIYCLPHSLLTSRVQKMFCALMMLHHPTLREQMTSAYIGILENAPAGQLQMKSTALFRSKFSQPLQEMLKKSTAPNEVIDLFRQIDLSLDQALPVYRPSAASAFAQYQELKQRPKERSVQRKIATLLEERRTDLCAYAMSQFSQEEKRTIAATFRSYRAYSSLHSPENYDSQLLDPILKLLKGAPKELLQKFKRELCSNTKSESKFRAWLESYSFSEEIKENITLIFKSYKDAPPKFNFQFIELYCDLLKASEVNPINVDLFANKIQKTFHFHYFPLLQMLNELHLSHFTPEVKGLILEKIGTAWAHGQKTAGRELASLMTLLLFAKQQSSILADALETGSFTEHAQELIQTTLQIRGEENMLEKFEHDFLCERMQGLFPVYIAKLRSLSSDTTMSALKKAVESILRDTYSLDRIDPKNSPQLQTLIDVRPDVYERWIKLDYSSTFSLSGGRYCVKTSTHYLDTFLSGTEVQGSCQHLDGNPSLNRCVMGYLDGKFLPLLVQDEKNTTVSKTFLVMNFDERGAPTLFLERYYTRNQHPELTHQIEQLALTIARDLGLPLVTKKFDTFIHHYSEGTPFEGMLVSHGNGWGPEYSDSAGGAVGSAFEGPYTFKSDKDGQLQYLYNPQAAASSSGSQET